jgi:hypothetical protein
VKILRNLALLSAALFLFYLFLGAPPTSDEELFHRKERQNLVGPSRVLAIPDWQAGHYERLVIAESDFGCALMPIYSGRSAREGVYYKERSGGVTIMVAPDDDWWRTGEQTRWLIAFDSVPEAVRAEITLTLLYNEPDSGIFETLAEHSYMRDYTASSIREYGGIFLFGFDFAADSSRTYLEDQAIDAFARMGDLRRNDTLFPATVRLYDMDGVLVYEQETVVN